MVEECQQHYLRRTTFCRYSYLRLTLSWRIATPFIAFAISIRSDSILYCTIFQLLHKVTDKVLRDCFGKISVKTDIYTLYWFIHTTNLDIRWQFLVMCLHWQLFADFRDPEVFLFFLEYSLIKLCNNQPTNQRNILEIIISLGFICLLALFLLMQITVD